MTAPLKDEQKKGRRADPAKDEAILEAAKALFLERGYAASVDDIADAASVSKQTIYTRYAGKHELLAAVVAETANNLVEALTVGPAPSTTEETLSRFGERYVEVVFDERRVAMLRLIISEVSSFPELAELYFKSGPAFVHGRLADFLEREACAGRVVIEDPRAAASDFLGLIKGADHVATLVGVAEPVSASERTARVKRAVANFMKLYSI
ncbi:MAG: TetR/AcrR family transcriptional regulator [Parvularculaceae bacterium]